jgi:hypothetical protein
LFRQGIRSKQTLEKYERTLKQLSTKVLEDILEGSFEERISQLVKHAKEDPDWTKDLLLNISKKLRERTTLPKNDLDYLSPSSIENYFKPIKKLFDMNDIAISWPRIYSTFPELENMSDGRGWTRNEIQKMINFANGAMERAIILIAASSGIRIGGFNLKWEDVYPIYKIDNRLTMELLESEEERAQLACAMLKVYRGSNEQYAAFITPEAYEALQEHRREWAHQVKREPKPTDPIFKREGSLPIKASTLSIKKRVERIVRKAGLRMSLQDGKRRHEVPIMNGFRRFWAKTGKETHSKDSPVSSLIKKEFMMGHTGLVKFDKNYFKTHALELAEEYLSVIPDLTISNENRLRLENLRLRKDNDVIQDVKEDMAKFKKQMELWDDLAYIQYGPDPEKRRERFEKFCEKNGYDKNKPVYYDVSFDKDRVKEFLELAKMRDEIFKNNK